MKRKPANDNDDFGGSQMARVMARDAATNDNDPTIGLTPKQARELGHVRALAKELLERITTLEDDLLSDDVKKRIREQTVPSPQMVERMAKLRRKRGWDG